MASCSFSLLLDQASSCGVNTDYPGVECVSLKHCTTDISRHLQLCKISSDEGIDSEVTLLLARAGKLDLCWFIVYSFINCNVSILYFLLLGFFTLTESHLSLNICPHHRAQFHGIRWRSHRTRCTIPLEIAGHKSLQTKGDRGVNRRESAYSFLQKRENWFQLDLVSGFHPFLINCWCSARGTGSREGKDGKEEIIF